MTKLSKNQNMILPIVMFFSALLFYGWIYSGTPDSGFLYGVAYWFPQMFTVVLTLPGAILYSVIGCIVYLSFRRRYRTA